MYVDRSVIFRTFLRKLFFHLATKLKIRWDDIKVSSKV